MSWVLDRGGAILYKAMWTSAERIGDFLGRRQREQGRPAATAFYSEQLELAPRDRAAFRRGLERNGPRAVTEFARAERIWTERARS